MKLLTASILTLLSIFSTQINAHGFDPLAEATKAISTPSQSDDLVGNVMSQLGLSQGQAEGGLGSLLSLAQSSLGSSDFSSISDSIPGIDGLLGAVPELDNDSGMSGLLSKAGGLGDSLQGGAMVYDAFEKLGISKDLAAPMIDIVKGYLDTNGTSGTSDLLMKGLGAIL
ncbi:hypothetical protein CXF83_03340 [Shewanella sp. Choline-02u-19]|uniref:DUF2780 domain-containing protein n=1 Tax=unclassified Shewanella TaxID=196818 RepID=UPI000C337FD0|nr:MULTISPECIES: DUF2780 domain-containing protein [unclassified Shewanella]PKG55694.1 hypothetical protein CXF82_18615 [Shewanella sp. GutDb-MelDb]PKG72757.1 hypothetical protein CXF86_20330 [Shewanella sp. GutCb]PKH57184.1 hypothetical protein CXF84_09415 [Shewanella sp. Bg11-22]PKI29701.1 hypothetical protein CXF83_03340 [Shewanella sp. Choline-02u-19]